MLFSQDRNELRKVFFLAWSKKNQPETLEPAEKIIVDLLVLHPEYQSFFENSEKNLHRDFFPQNGEVNPFLHLSMHIAIHEQLSINQPKGIVEAHQKLLQQIKDPHEVEHTLMNCLGEMLWKAQQQNTAPDPADYFACIAHSLNQKT